LSFVLIRSLTYTFLVRLWSLSPYSRAAAQWSDLCGVRNVRCCWKFCWKQWSSIPIEHRWL